MNIQSNWRKALEKALPPSSSPLYQKYLDWHLNVEARARVIEHNLNKFISLENLKILDFGCGEGGMSVYFARKGFEVWAVDIDREKLARVKLRAEENEVKLNILPLSPEGRAENLPENYFEVILCLDVIEHCQDPRLSLREMKRLLKKEGLLYLTTPNQLGLGWLFSDPHYSLPFLTLFPKPIADYLVKRFRKMENDVSHLFGRRELEKLFQKTGLEVIYSYADEVKEKLNQPERIVSPFKKKVFQILSSAHLIGLIPIFLPLLHYFSTTLIYILKKLPENGPTPF